MVQTLELYAIAVVIHKSPFFTTKTVALLDVTLSTLLLTKHWY